MITCWLHRQPILRAAAAGQSPAGAAAYHLAACASCRKLHAAHSGVARRLVAGKAAADQPISPFLHARIMAGIRRPETAAARFEPPVFNRWLVPFISACFMIAGFCWVVGHIPPEPGTVERAGDARPLIAKELAKAGNFSHKLQVRQWTGKLDEPLQQEMSRLMLDSKAAVASLETAFVPASLRATLLDEMAK